MYLLTHSLVLVLVAVMKPKVLKTKISHADPPTLSHALPLLTHIGYVRRVHHRRPFYSTHLQDARRAELRHSQLKNNRQVR